MPTARATRRVHTAGMVACARSPARSGSRAGRSRRQLIAAHCARVVRSRSVAMRGRAHSRMRAAAACARPCSTRPRPPIRASWRRTARCVTGYLQQRSGAGLDPSHAGSRRRRAPARAPSCSGPNSSRDPASVPELGTLQPRRELDRSLGSARADRLSSVFVAQRTLSCASRLEPRDGLAQAVRRATSAGSAARRSACSTERSTSPARRGPSRQLGVTPMRRRERMRELERGGLLARAHVHDRLFDGAVEREQVVAHDVADEDVVAHAAGVAGLAPRVDLDRLAREQRAALKIATTPASPCGSWRGPYTLA